MRIMLANFAKLVNDSGGMAKVTIAMANEFVRRGHEVVLVYSDVREGEFFFPLDAKVQSYDLRHFRGQSIDFPLCYKLKREFYRLFKDHLHTQNVTFEFLRKHISHNAQIILAEFHPDIIVSSNLITSDIYLHTLKTKVPVITMSHGDPAYYFHDTPASVRESFRDSVAAQVLLPSFAQHIKEHMPDVNTVVIGNEVPDFGESADLAREKEQYKIIFIGGLIKNIKRPHLLVEAFGKISRQFPEWIVELWGPEERYSYKVELEILIKTLGLGGKVFIKGATKNVASVLREGDVFVISSSQEGFGLTLGEAMSMGLPPIGYQNCPAVNELICNGKNGILCADGAEPLAEALQILMENRDLRIKYGKAAKETMKKYSPQAIWDTWEKLIKAICVKK